MSLNQQVKSHPLDFSDLDEESKVFNISSTTSPVVKFTVSATTRPTLINTEPTSSNLLSPKQRHSTNLENVLIKPKVHKRMAPKRPNDLVIEKLQKTPTIDENKPVNFYIDVDQVSWFYRGDKESGVNQPTSAMSTTSLHTNLSSSNLTNEQPQQNINETNNNDINNNNNTCPGSINLTSKKWHMFSKVDSFNIELEYRDMISKKQINFVSEPKLVPVLEDLFEVNLNTKKCYSIYWKVAKTMTVMRCIWYTDSGEPFEERAGEEIEKKHVELFKDVLLKSPESDNSLNGDVQENKLSPELASSVNDDQPFSSGNKLVKSDSSKTQIESSIGSLQFDDGIITWYSKEEVFWEKTKLNLFDKVSMGFSKFRNKISGVKIKRGLKEKPKENEQDDKPNEISHVVFVVHGIAQKLYENSIIKNCEDLRKECEKKKKEHYSAYKNQRYIFIPVDWRSSLTLDDGIVESITPKTIQTIRDKLNSSALDIMYYTSPLFRAEIMTSLTSELNRLYSLFCQKNPYFKKKHNKVSIVAHSLGTVICYDIITSNNSYTQFTNSYGEDLNQEQLVFDHFSHNDSGLLNEYLDCKRRMQEIERHLIKSNENIGLLEFKCENFFSLGSPLAVFLALRGVRPAGIGSQDHILPKHLCKHLFNIFHPSDPIAYRLEPLVLKHYATKSALEIQKASDPNSLKVTYKEMNEKRAALNVDLKSTLTKIPGKKKEKVDAKSAELSQIKEKDDLSSSASFNKSLNIEKSQIDQVELEAALDYQLQDSNFELMATIRAHTCYWKSSDTALFIMQQLCTNDNELSDVLTSPSFT